MVAFYIKWRLSRRFGRWVEAASSSFHWRFVRMVWMMKTNPTPKLNVLYSFGSVHASSLPTNGEFAATLTNWIPIALILVSIHILSFFQFSRASFTLQPCTGCLTMFITSRLRMRVVKSCQLHFPQANVCLPTHINIWVYIPGTLEEYGHPLSKKSTRF